VEIDAAEAEARKVYTAPQARQPTLVQLGGL
jgi:hypothetical protein